MTEKPLETTINFLKFVVIDKPSKLRSFESISANPDSEIWGTENSFQRANFISTMG